ncbi:MAG: GNAT family N-acetyltransferase [Gemmatimonadota bacterium]
MCRGLRGRGRVTQEAWREFERPRDPVWSGYFETLGDAAGRASGALVLVAVEAGRIVGTATVELDRTIESDGTLEPDQANFRMLAVDPDWRGGGIGRALVEACLEGARERAKPPRRCTRPRRWLQPARSTARSGSSATPRKTSSRRPASCCGPTGSR